MRDKKVIITDCKCGEKASLKVGPDQAFSGNSFLAWVECSLCGKKGRVVDSERRAVRVWNELIEKELDSDD